MTSIMKNDRETRKLMRVSCTLLRINIASNSIAPIEKQKYFET